MFTGLIEEVGTVRSMRTGLGRAELRLAAPHAALGTRIGDSIAVNGCCLTVTSVQDEELSFDLLEETISRTNLGTLKRGSAINLERPLTAGSRLGGHFVQGHVDCTAPIISFDKKASDWRLEVRLAAQDAHYVVEKGSIVVNGISLTVAEVNNGSFTVWVIPYTLRSTNLKTAQPGDLVNLEFDLLAKYVERMLARALMTGSQSPSTPPLDAVGSAVPSAENAVRTAHTTAINVERSTKTKIEG
jgi:riboflavin synthase